MVEEGVRGGVIETPGEVRSTVVYRSSVASRFASRSGSSVVGATLFLLVALFSLSACGESSREEPAQTSSGDAVSSGAKGSGSADSRVEARSDAGPATTGDERRITYQARTMGTWGGVTLSAADSLEALPHARRVHEAWSRVDSLMSNWTDDSEVARINREGGAEPIEIHPEVARVLETALAVGGQSGGAFDITVEPVVRAWGFLGGEKRVPDADEIETILERVGQQKIRFDPEARTLAFEWPGMRIDLGGVAKGYGVDEGARVLREIGVETALIDLSGNMAALGSPPGRESWVIGVRDPRDRHAYFARLDLRDACIATSGNYERFVSEGGKRYGHILDPRTGWPAQGLLSVTVLAPSATEADAWATALIVLGRARAVELVRDRDDLQVVLVEPRQDAGDHDPRDVVWVDGQLRERFSLNEGLESVFDVRFF